MYSSCKKRSSLSSVGVLAAMWSVKTPRTVKEEEDLELDFLFKYEE